MDKPNPNDYPLTAEGDSQYQVDNARWEAADRLRRKAQNEQTSIVLNKLCDQQRQEIAELRAKLAAAEKDAERYRFLRDELIEYKPAGYDGRKDGRFDLVWLSGISDLDRAVDIGIAHSTPRQVAAIAKEKE